IRAATRALGSGRPEAPAMFWSRRKELNAPTTKYDLAALPLSYTGTTKFYQRGRAARPRTSGFRAILRITRRDDANWHPHSSADAAAAVPAPAPRALRWYHAARHCSR